MEITKIRSYSFDEFKECVSSFHGAPAPGVLLGGVMVEFAYQNLPDEGLFDVLCETDRCLPDAVQLLTPCTVGNGWLQVISTGRFALSFYNKQTGEGIRVFVDSDKIKNFEQISTWFFKLKPKKETHTNQINDQIQKAGTDILSVQKIAVNLDLIKRKSRKGFNICSRCNEAYPAADGDMCLSCQGKFPYFSIAEQP